MQAHIKFRVAKSKAAEIILIVLAFFVTAPLLFIIYYIFQKGIKVISWNFLTQLPKPVGEVGGGIVNALVGTGLIVLYASIMAIPIGILCGIYLSEHKSSKLAYFSRLCVDVLQGVPSIVIGIVVYFWIVKPLHTFSAISGSVALAIMMLPIIIKSTEETLKLLPASLKEAAIALAIPYHRVITKVLLPCGISGSLSGIILSVARIAGETAPLLFTAFGNPYLNTSMLKPMQSLPLLIFNYATSPYDEWHDLAWGAALILLFTVLLLNIITKLTTRKWNVQL